MELIDLQSFGRGTRTIFGDPCRRSCLYVTPLTSDAELDPSTLWNQDLTPLTVDTSNGQVSDGKTFVDAGFAPGRSPKVIWSLPPVLKCSV